MPSSILLANQFFIKFGRESKKSILRESRLSLTTQLVKFINQYQQYPIFISGSATGIYGDQDEQTITETSKTAKPLPHNYAKIGKILRDKLMREFV